MNLINLFLGFLKVGCFSFGGAYSAIPLIRDVVLDNGWMDEELLTYMIAVSESTPGPIMVNIATYVGFSQAGIMGAALATFAVVLPAFLIVVLVTAVLSKILNNKFVRATLSGIKPSVIGIILATGIWMMINNIMASSGTFLDYKAFALTVILGGIYWGRKYVLKGKVSPILLICISAVMGCIVYAI